MGGGGVGRGEKGVLEEWLLKFFLVLKRKKRKRKTEKEL